MLQKFTVHPFKGKAFKIKAYNLTISDNKLTFKDNCNDSSNFYINKEHIVCVTPDKTEVDETKAISFKVQTVENDTPIDVRACSFKKENAELTFYADKSKTPIAGMYFNVSYVVAVYPDVP